MEEIDGLASDGTADDDEYLSADGEADHSSPGAAAKKKKKVRVLNHNFMTFFGITVIDFTL